MKHQVLNKLKGFSWAAFKAAFVKYMKKQAVKAALKKLAISGGIKGWLIQFAVNHLIEAGDEYLLEPLMVKFGYRKGVKDGKKIYYKLENSQDVDDWRNNAGDV